MERLNGWKRLWVVVSVLAGLYVMLYVSDEFLNPAKYIKAFFDAESVRLDATLKQVSTGVGRGEAVKQAEEAIAASRVSYVKIMRDLPKATVLMFILAAIAAILVGVPTFLAGFAMEWVYRGFLPLPIAPMEADQPPPLGVPEASQESRLALGHQEIQQNPSVSPTPLQEPVQRE